MTESSFNRMKLDAFVKSHEIDLPDGRQVAQ